MDFLQEKFQITAPPKKEDGADAGWVFPFRNSEARLTGEAGYMHRNNKTSASLEPMGPKFNQLSPGMEIDNQMRSRIQHMPLTVAGETDVTNCVTPKAMIGGFTRHDMKGTDDAYTGEHVDLFYGISYGQDDEGNNYEGFIERNNNLDRL